MTTKRASLMPAAESDTAREFYDYEARYFTSGTVRACPSRLNEAMVSQMHGWLENTIKVTGVCHWGRVDLILDEAKESSIIRVNTVTGMTEHSLVPIAAKQASLEMPDLVLTILEPTLIADDSHV